VTELWIRINRCPKPKKNSKQGFVVGPKFGSRRSFRANVTADKGQVAEQRALAAALKAEAAGWPLPVKAPCQITMLFAVNHYRRVDGPNLSAMVYDALVEARIIEDDSIDQVDAGSWEAKRLCDLCDQIGKGNRCAVGRRKCDKAYMAVRIRTEGEG